MANKRNTGLDIARIIAMQSIVVLHILGQGGVIENSTQWTFKYWMLWWIEASALCGVDLFALLSGWLGICSVKKSTYKVVNLFAVVSFYCVVITVIWAIAEPSKFIGITSWANSLAPYLNGRYWYFLCYVPISICQPYINKLILALSVEQHKKLCIVVLVTFCLIPSILNVDLFGIKRGYSFSWLLMCYLMGAYLRRSEVRCNTKHGTIIFVLCVLVELVAKAVYDRIYCTNVHYMIDYTSPLTLIMATILLLTLNQVKTCRIAGKTFRMLSESAFDVYIIHCHILIFDNIIANNFVGILGMRSARLLISLICIAVVIYLCLSLVGIFRKVVFKNLGIDKIVEVVANKFDKTLY